MQFAISNVIILILLNQKDGIHNKVTPKIGNEKFLGYDFLKNLSYCTCKKKQKILSNMPTLKISVATSKFFSFLTQFFHMKFCDFKKQICSTIINF